VGDRTRNLNVVPHPSTDRAQTALTLVIGHQKLHIILSHNFNNIIAKIVQCIERLTITVWLHVRSPTIPFFKIVSLKKRLKAWAMFVVNITHITLASHHITSHHITSHHITSNHITMIHITLSASNPKR
jgi:hypothetical protein